MDAQLHDANGDGLPDTVQSYECLSGGCMAGGLAGMDSAFIYPADYHPLVLSKINLSTGGSYTMNYKASTQYTSGGSLRGIYL